MMRRSSGRTRWSQRGDWAEALRRPWWPYRSEGTGLYRPLTSGALAGEWALFNGSSFGFHATNVLLHSAVSLLALLLLLELGSVPGAFAGAALFAIHPLHTEVVANVVGQAEILSALWYLAACLLYLRGRRWTGLPRVLRLLGLGVLYFLSLASKEIGVTLPGALLLLELVRPEPEGGKGTPFWSRVGDESPAFLLLGVSLAAYLGLRFLVLGTVVGEVAAPVFQVVGPTARVLTAIALWPQYARLHLFPLDLSSDYDPGVLFPSEGVDMGVIFGILILASLAAAAVKGLRTSPWWPLACSGSWSSSPRFPTFSSQPGCSWLNARSISLPWGCLWWQRVWRGPPFPSGLL